MSTSNIYPKPLKVIPFSSKGIVDKAKKEIPYFEKHFAEFEKQIVIGGYAKSTEVNYSRAVAKVCLHYKKSLLSITPDELHDYLYKVVVDNNRSNTQLRHTLYGLKFFLRVHNVDDKIYKFPGFKRDKSLPTVLSRQEVKRLLQTPPGLKYRMIFSLIYSAGLRIGELINLRIRDVDFDRKQIKIEKGKGNKSRYVALSEYLIFDLQNYIKQYQPMEYLFNGKWKGRRLHKSVICVAYHTAVRKAGIIKKVTLHTLRHSFATHMLENGVDLISIKEAMGHAHINTTMIYLHVAKMKRVYAKSPLDGLYE